MAGQMTLLEARRQQARHFGSLARREQFMTGDIKLARFYAFKAIAALAMMELEISPHAPFCRNPPGFGRLSLSRRDVP